MAIEGPLIQMEAVHFDTVDRASVRVIIRRTETVGGDFVLRVEKRHNMWVVVDERIDWGM